MRAAIQEALGEHLDHIPPELRDALLDAAFSMSIEEISDRYGLHEYQEVMLEKETAFLIAGVTRPEEYIPRLADELDVPQTTSKHLAAEINLWVFNPIKDVLFDFHESLANVYENTENDAAPAEAAPEPLNPALPQEISSFLQGLDTELPQKRTMAQDVAIKQMREGGAEKAETVLVGKKLPESVAQKSVTVQTGHIDPYQEPIE